MKKFLISLLVILVLVGAAYLTLKGKMPVLSNLVYKQIDLGIENETADEIYSFYDEIGYADTLREEPKSGTLVFEGGIDIEHTFTQSEINSWITAWEGEWTDLPFSNPQIKINKDGSVEASSMITISSAEDFAKELGYTDAEISKAENYLGYLPEQLPLYANGTAEIINNVATIDLQNFKLSRYTIPSSIYSDISSVLEDFIQKTINLSDSTNISSAMVTPEGVEFVGTVPASITVE